MSFETPDQIRSLQRKLYRKAQAEPVFRLWWDTRHGVHELSEDRMKNRRTSSSAGRAGGLPRPWDV
jgi:hypothetical protein